MIKSPTGGLSFRVVLDFLPTTYFSVALINGFTTRHPSYISLEYLSTICNGTFAICFTNSILLGMSVVFWFLLL